MSVTSRISYICKKRKVKQTDLIKIGCGSKQTVNQVWNGKQNPNTQFLEAFFKAYPEINSRWIFTGEGLEEYDIVEDSHSKYGYCKECIKKEGIIEYQQKELNHRNQEIESLKKELYELGERIRQTTSKAS